MAMKSFLEIRLLEVQSKSVVFDIRHQSTLLVEKLRVRDGIRVGDWVLKTSRHPEVNESSKVLYGWGSESFRNGLMLSVHIGSFKEIENLVSGVNLLMNQEMVSCFSIEKEYFSRQSQGSK